MRLRFFTTAKIHKTKSIEEISLDDHKLRCIIDQTGNYISMRPKLLQNTPTLFLDETHVGAVTGFI